MFNFGWLLSAMSLFVLAETTAKERDFSIWEPEMQAFDALDAEKAPATGGVLFVGSSSIRMWDLSKYFPEREFINRGFGGSHIIDSIHFADRIILKHRPRTVIFYAGDNDIADGKSPEQVLHDFRRLVELIHQDTPKTKIAFVAIKPSLNRWKLAKEMEQANKLVADVCDHCEYLTFIDIWTPMLDDDGRPRRELFKGDGLHLNHAGYQLWTKLVEPHVK